jgi:hypothetical protein
MKAESRGSARDDSCLLLASREPAARVDPCIDLWGARIFLSTHSDVVLGFNKHAPLPCIGNDIEAA